MRPSSLSLSNLMDARIAVLGFGRAGRSVTDFLLSHGNVPAVYTETPVDACVKEPYEERGVRFACGFPTEFEESVLVRSPGIRPDTEPIRRCLAAGALLTGEVDLFLASTRATTIGVTGSDGKTTTASMIAALLRAAGKRVVLGGNNGKPLLCHLDTLTDADFAVVELSSFQLMTAPSPDVAVITNLTPNHLNWHRDLLEYAAAKCRIFTQGAHRLVTNADCPATRAIATRATLPTICFGKGDRSECGVWIAGEDLVLCTQKSRRTVRVFHDFCLPGLHNRENFACAVGAVLPFVDDATICSVARSFRGVAHRLQTVDTVRGVRYINSSIDTSPTRTAAALEALECSPLVIAGGRGKGLDLSPLAEVLVKRGAGVFLYGETAREIAALVGERLPCVVSERFQDAFFAAAGSAKRGDTVLLSPGCTAFGEFRDFEERGEVFCRLVETLKEEEIQGGIARTDPRNGGADERYGL